MSNFQTNHLRTLTDVALLELLADMRQLQAGAANPATAQAATAAIYRVRAEWRRRRSSAIRKSLS